MSQERRVQNGFVLGKFMPLHEGHVHLMRFAEASSARLTIMVCSLPYDPIPGPLRVAWVRALFPAARVVHQDWPIVQHPGEASSDEAFWQEWQEAIARLCPGETFDAVFASETYGLELARRLGAEFLPVDRLRQGVPTSGTVIRDDPMRHWEDLPVVTRPYFVKRVAILGAESVGKTTLTERLAAAFRTVAVPEYGRQYLVEKDVATGSMQFEPEDMANIARGQLASEASLAHRANRMLFCDTDVLTTLCWSQFYFNAAPDWLAAVARTQTYDLTFVLAPDVPFVDDGTRGMGTPGVRAAFHQHLLRMLREIGNRSFVLVSGAAWDGRFDQVRAELRRTLGDWVDDLA